jgi:UDP-galactopyranose mutase
MTAQADWLVVGAGFTGATVARRLAEDFGVRVLLIDQRSHLAGNAYDSREQTGQLVHRYGPHIFHTNSAGVVSFLSRFTDWRVYEHHVKVMVDENLVPMPFGFRAIDALFSPTVAEDLKSRLIEVYGREKRVPILKLRTSPDKALRELAEFVFAKVFRDYSLRHWGCELEELEPSVTARVPIVISDDERYFSDAFQGLPTQGYSRMFERMLEHPGIGVSLNTRYEDLSEKEKVLPTVYTGAIDLFYGFAFGRLPYRSMDFEYARAERAYVQPCATINYPSGLPYIRSTEQAWLTGEHDGQTILVREHPCAHEWGKNEPYYPVPMASSHATAQRYFQAAESLRGRVWFAGRLGDYRYYNMDQACARAHALVDKEIAPLLGRGRIREF